MWKHTICNVVMVIVLLWAISVHAGRFEGQIFFNNGLSTLTLQQVEEGTWTGTEKGRSFTVSLTKDGKVTYFSGNEGKGGKEMIAQGVMNSGKLRMTQSDGAFYAYIQCRAEKIKIELSEGAEPFEMKISDEKIKVRQHDKVYGKIKYYPDTDKTKAKDEKGIEVAYSKSFSHTTAVLGAFLLPSIDQKMRTFICLFLLAAGK
ncbi:MAG: hypothetical protein ACMUJM_23495 [bacterium]